METVPAAKTEKQFYIEPVGACEVTGNPPCSCNHIQDGSSRYRTHLLPRGGSNGFLCRPFWLVGGQPGPISSPVQSCPQVHMLLCRVFGSTGNTITPLHQVHMLGHHFPCTKQDHKLDFVCSMFYHILWFGLVICSFHCFFIQKKKELGTSLFFAIFFLL